MPKRHLTSEILPSSHLYPGRIMDNIPCALNSESMPQQHEKTVLSPGTLKRPMTIVLSQLCRPKSQDCGLVTDFTSALADSCNFPAPSSNDGNFRLGVTSSQSMPCIVTSASTAPTQVLPFLYLGSHGDALSEKFFKAHGITHVLNVTTACHMTALVPEENCLRIPVYDTHNDRLLPFFQQAFHFIDGVRESEGRVLVHCLAGISRSSTVVIAYVMHHLRMSLDAAYRFVKQKRPEISPNFNFLGQLTEFESQLQLSKKVGLNNVDESAEESLVKRPCFSEQDILLLPFARPNRKKGLQQSAKSTISPTTALSKLNFNQSTVDFPQGLKCLGNLTSFQASNKDRPVASDNSIAQRLCTLHEMNDEDVIGTSNLGNTASMHAFRIPPLSSSNVVSPVAEVILRSPVKLSKRPTRPNSIAVTSFTFMMPSPCVSLEKSSISSPQNSLDTNTSLSQKPVAAVPIEISENVIPCKRREKENTTERVRSGFVRQSDETRKSRSLEDIFIITDDTSCLKHVAMSTSIFSAEDISLCDWQREVIQTNGNLASMGSVHSSLEMMQVF